ncbi:hypothetical protein [Massilia sp. TWP1-3-3]|uniref:hypothetical protein n=1 Tax=Massilia sp. TWP1-3-3 TaxID=2804573 RepID=UPI003CEF6FE7
MNAPPTAALGIFDGAHKCSMNLSEEWLLTGKVGVARHGLNVDRPDASGTAATFASHTTKPLFGVGTEFRFTDRFSETLELTDYGASNKPKMKIHARNLEAGIQSRF